MLCKSKLCVGAPYLFLSHLMGEWAGPVCLLARSSQKPAQKQRGKSLTMQKLIQMQSEKSCWFWKCIFVCFNLPFESFCFFVFNDILNVPQQRNTGVSCIIIDCTNNGNIFQG